MLENLFGINRILYVLNWLEMIFFLNEEEGKRNFKNCVNGVSFLFNLNILVGKYNYLLYSICKFVVCFYEISV